MKRSKQNLRLLSHGAIGDSYGFCFEFVDPKFVARNNDLSYHQHPEFSDVLPGVYSDDTQMQLALAELIVSGSDWSPIIVANHFVEVYKRDPRPGYAKRFRALLDEVKNGSELLARINPESERNGAAMRAPIIGLFPDLDEVKYLAELQASLTHNTKGGVDSSIAAALMCHYFKYTSDDKKGLPNFLSNHLPDYDWSGNWQGRVPVHGISTVQAALSAILSSDSLSEILKACIAFTGDVDSVATIACSSCSVSDSIQLDIPESLWSGMESTRFGLDYLQKMDAKVWERIASV